jgi:hypothetical protein
MYVIQLLGSTQRITESLWIQKWGLRIEANLYPWVRI